MNKQEGFTLIEMISVIALIGVIGLTMTLGLSGIQKNQKTKKEDNAYAKVKSALNVYASTGGTFTSNNFEKRVKNLLDEDLITEEDKELCSSNTSCQTLVTGYKLINKNSLNNISSTVILGNHYLEENETFKLKETDLEFNNNNKEWFTTLKVTSNKNFHILVSANNSQKSGTGSLSYDVNLKENETTNVNVTIYDKNYINKKTSVYHLKAPILNYIYSFSRYLAFQYREDSNSLNPSSTENSECYNTVDITPTFDIKTSEYTVHLKKSCKYFLFHFSLHNSTVTNTYNADISNVNDCSAINGCYAIVDLEQVKNKPLNYTYIDIDSTLGKNSIRYRFKYDYFDETEVK